MNNIDVVEVQFDPEDLVTAGDAASLIDELVRVETKAEIKRRHEGAPAVEGMALVALIALIAPTAAGLSVTAAFIYRVFQKGVILDLRGEHPKIRKNSELPRGTLLVINRDGSSRLKEGISDKDIGSAIREVLQQQAPKNKEST